MIVDRRSLIAGTLATAGTLSLATRGTAAAPRAIALYDPARPEGVAFAQAAAQAGAKAHPLSGDRGALLRGLLPATRGRIAGLSTFADYLLVADGAREFGWRLAGHAEHRAGDHRCGGCLAPAAPALIASGAAWPSALPALMLRSADTPAAAARTGGGSQMLVSWLLTRA